VAPLYTGLGFGVTQAAIVRQGAIRYVLIDRRLATAPPQIGVYFETNEDGAYMHTVPLDPSALAKFDRLLGVNLIYDSGAIQIYQLGENVREP